MYVEENYGQNYKDGVIAAAANEGIEVDSFPFNYQDETSILSALKLLEETKLNIVVCVAFEEDVEYLIGKLMIYM